MNKYSDIINLDYKPSLKHPRMSIKERSAQFSPFSALVSYSDKIKDASIFNFEKLELLDDAKEILDNKLKEINDNISLNKQVSIKYFSNIDGHGKYINKTGIVKKIDYYNKKIIFKDGSFISTNDILDIVINKN